MPSTHATPTVGKDIIILYWKFKYGTAKGTQNKRERERDVQGGTARAPIGSVRMSAGWKRKAQKQGVRAWDRTSTGRVLA